MQPNKQTNTKILTYYLATVTLEQDFSTISEDPVQCYCNNFHLCIQDEHHSKIKVDHIRDTLIQRDSIYHYIKGDTTIIERWHYLQGTTKVAKVDTFIKVDSVPYPVTTTKEVVEVKEVNILHWWQKMLIAIGGGSLIALALLITYRLRKRT